MKNIIKIKDPTKVWCVGYIMQDGYERDEYLDYVGKIYTVRDIALD